MTHMPLPTIETKVSTVAIMPEEGRLQLVMADDEDDEPVCALDEDVDPPELPVALGANDGVAVKVAAATTRHWLTAAFKADDEPGAERLMVALPEKSQDAALRLVVS